MNDLTPKERIRLIERALRECGQDVTWAAVREQFKRETGREPERTLFDE